MKSHPTNYAGVNFRSRLEARWAAFFDLVGWRWQYEPVDLEGWVPDFSITGQAKPVYVEVKPIEWPTSEDWSFDLLRRSPDLEKVRQYCRTPTNKQDECLILGSCPLCMVANVLRNRFEPKLGGLIDDLDVDLAILHRSRKRGYDFCAFTVLGGPFGRLQNFRDVMEEEDFSRASMEEIARLWRQAGNLTQWKPAYV